MKTTVRLFVLACTAMMFLFFFGCTKKTVVPPGPGMDSGVTEMDGGTNIDYPLAEGGYSEQNLPAEGRLDDTLTPGQAGSAATNEQMIDQSSEEYKMAHGRSSSNLSPVYFNFDQAGIRPDMTEVLFRNAEYINSVPGTLIVLEGNCDERGTNEYNLALGERRALNTMQYLINLGVDARRMRTLSYGEEKPLFLGQNEEAYSMNRRVDFVMQ